MFEGEKTHYFPRGQSLSVILPPDSNIEKNSYCEKMICLTPTRAVPAVRAAVKPSYPTEMTRHNKDSTKVALLSLYA